MELFEKVTMEHLEGENRDLAELIGLENFKKMVKVYSGSTLYIPKVESITKEARDERIREEFTGGNLHELALRYGLTDRRVREILSENHTGEIPGQISLFDEDIKKK